MTDEPGARGAARWGTMMPLLIGQLPGGLFGIGGARRGFSKLDSWLDGKRRGLAGGLMPGVIEEEMEGLSKPGVVKPVEVLPCDLRWLYSAISGAFAWSNLWKIFSSALDPVASL